MSHRPSRLRPGRPSPRPHHASRARDHPRTPTCPSGTEKTSAKPGPSPRVSLLLRTFRRRRPTRARRFGFFETWACDSPIQTSPSAPSRDPPRSSSARTPRPPRARRTASTRPRPAIASSRRTHRTDASETRALRRGSATIKIPPSPRVAPHSVARRVTNTRNRPRRRLCT